MQSGFCLDSEADYRVFLTLSRPTVLVLDNASVHKKAFKDHFAAWEERGLFIFFLPPYSPHLNIVEILWKKVKYEWLQVKHYADKNTLREAVGHILSEVGKSLTIAFQPLFFIFCTLRGLPLGQNAIQVQQDVADHCPSGAFYCFLVTHLGLSNQFFGFVGVGFVVVSFGV
jgi:transposase